MNALAPAPVSETVSVARKRTDGWVHGFAAAPGHARLPGNLPSQVVALAGADTLPFLVVCDGRERSDVSHLGAKAATRSLKESVWSLAHLLHECLDLEDAAAAASLWRTISLGLVRAMVRQQLDLAERQDRPATDFEFTALTAVVGPCHIGWFRVGNGALVLQREDGLATATCEAGQLDQVTPSPVTGQIMATGLIPAQGVLGVAGFNSGVARKLVGAANTPSKGVAQVLDRIAGGAWQNAQLQNYLERSLWHESQIDDDRGLAYLVRPLV